MEHRKRIITAFAILFGSAALFFGLGHTGVIILTSLVAMGAYYELLTLILDRRLKAEYFPLVLSYSLAVAAGFLGYLIWRPQGDLLPICFAILAFLLFAFVFSHSVVARALPKKRWKFILGMQWLSPLASCTWWAF